MVKRFKEIKEKLFLKTIASFYRPGFYAKLAQTPEEKLDVYRFRYKVYAEELGRAVPGLDHEEKMIKDELDEIESSHIFYVKKEKEIIATVRVCYFKGNITKNLIEYYSLQGFSGLESEKICLMERFMVSKKFRGTIESMKLLIPVLAFFINKKEAGCFICCCKPGLVGNYRKLGMFPYTGNFIDYPDGLEIPLIGFIDKHHLMSYRCLGPHFIKNRSYRDFSTYTEKLIINDSVILEKNKILINLEESNVYEQKNIYNLLSKELVDKFVTQGSYILNIKNPATVMNQGASEQDVFFVLKGHIDLYKNGSFFKRALPGETVGAVDYLSESGKRKNKAVCSNSSIFVIKKNALDKVLREANSVDFIGLLSFFGKEII